MSSQKQRIHRELIRTRRQLVEHRGSVARQIKSKLLFHGILSPFPNKFGWGRTYIQWLKDLNLQSSYLRESLDTLLYLMNTSPERSKRSSKG
jgi:hypothetical protein